MRYESTVTSLGWIPSEAIEGMMRLPSISVPAITVQGEPGAGLFLVIDGFLDVEVDGRIVAEVGPGDIVGERAILEGGLRTSTVRARTAARVAVQSTVTADRKNLAVIASGRRADEA